MSPTRTSTSTAPVKPSSKPKCEDCGKGLPRKPAGQGGQPRRLCNECKAERQRKRQRVPRDPKRACEICSVQFDSYKGDQKYCPDCRDEARRQKAHVTDPAAADPQMARLFKNYHERKSISIEDRPDGTRFMVISDAQIPFIDEPLWKAILNFTGDYRPHDLIINGDWIDAYEISDFDKRPQRLFDLQSEFEQAGDSLDDLRKRIAKDGQVWWIDGNHEERVNRTIWRHAQGFAFMVGDVSSGMHLDERTAGYVPYGKHIDYLGFTVTHGNFVSQYSAYTAKRHADRYHSSGCNGHTHRAGSYSYRDGNNRSHTWYEIGCLCRLDLEYVRGIANWQQAFLTGEVRGGVIHPQLVRVIENHDARSFMAGGSQYEIYD